MAVGLGVAHLQAVLPAVRRSTVGVNPRAVPSTTTCSCPAEPRGMCSQVVAGGAGAAREPLRHTTATTLASKIAGPARSRHVSRALLTSRPSVPAAWAPVSGDLVA